MNSIIIYLIKTKTKKNTIHHSEEKNDATNVTHEVHKLDREQSSSHRFSDTSHPCDKNEISFSRNDNSCSDLNVRKYS